MNKVDGLIKEVKEKMNRVGIEWFFDNREMTTKERYEFATKLIELDREGEIKFRTTWPRDYRRVVSERKAAEKALTTPKKPKRQTPKGYVVAKYSGYDAETGERFEAGELIRYCEISGGWIKADNY